MGPRVGAFAVAGGFVLVLALVLAVATRGVRTTKAPAAKPTSLYASLVNGMDGCASTSKLQCLVWTTLGIFAFCAVFAERMFRGLELNDTSIPPNLLIAMGFSGVTLSAAKGITSSYASAGVVDKSPVANAKGGLLVTDDGLPDLSKVQMVAFTVIAVVVYVIHLIRQGDQPVFVDIEPALMVLVGLSHGAYIGKKLTTTEAPRVSGLVPVSGTTGSTISVSGVNFGDQQGGSIVSVDGVAVHAATWTDSSISFAWPTTRATGAPWSPGDRGTVSVVVNGRETTSPVPFSVIAAPRLASLNPPSGNPGTQVVLVGTGFGDIQGANAVKVGTVTVQPTVWSDKAISFPFPATNASNVAWKTGDKATVALVVDSRDVPGADFTVS